MSRMGTHKSFYNKWWRGMEEDKIFDNNPIFIKFQNLHIPKLLSSQTELSKHVGSLTVLRFSIYSGIKFVSRPAFRWGNGLVVHLQIFFFLHFYFYL